MHILIIEDEQRVANAIKRSLNEAGHQCQICHDADLGMSMARQQKYNLIILDILLPGSINGLDITKQLRLDNINTPILILSALDDLKDKLEGFGNGADDYLVKPFSIKELKARVAAIAKRSPRQLGVTLKLSDLEFNTVTNVVSRNRTVIRLSNRELKLLRYLMFKSDQVLSKEEIITHVWSEDCDILPNTVEVYIGYLRRKIDYSFPDSPKLIHTHFGFGYMLADKSHD